MSNYNKRYNCVYVRVPRTGTASLGSILNVGGGHMPVVDIKRRFENNPPTSVKWDDLFKFGFVRNPYTRFVSAYYNLHLDEKEGDINRFIQDEDKMNQLWKHEHTLVRPANEYLCDEDGKIMVNYVGFFEDLHNHWNFIFEKLGVKEPTIVHSNRTDRPKKKLTKKSKRILYDIYRKDFKIFVYEKGKLHL
jgi:hypothetical protein